jgi:mevalonate pyrophosphate decarboxylase
MKNIVKLTESDLNRIIERVINENGMRIPSEDEMRERNRKNNSEMYELKRKHLDRAIYQMAEMSRNGDNEGVSRMSDIIVRNILPEIDSYVNF